jgi:hypothetical protein
MHYLSALMSAAIEFLQACLMFLELEGVNYPSPTFPPRGEDYVQLMLFDVNYYSSSIAI